MAANPRAERFFHDITLVMIAIIIAGFGSSALFLPQFPFPPTSLLIFHGIVTLSWYVLTVNQARLIAGSQYDLHRKMGQASVLLTLLIVVTGYFVIKDAMSDPTTTIGGMTPQGSTIFPTMDLLGFILFYALAIAMRSNGAAHKRLMVLAGLMMLPPATARLGFTVGFEPLPALAALLIAASFLVYDWRTRRKPHWASVLGLVVAVGGGPVRLIFGHSEGWARLADLIY